MKKLGKPFGIGNALDIYKVCEQAYSSQKMKKSLSIYEKMIDSVSREYDKHIPNEFDKFSHPKTSINDKKIMKNVYENKFVRERCGNYYDTIIANANQICPFCGEGWPTNLDHFLPKAEYPFLIVTPENLVPSCKDCNMEKNNANPVSNEEVPLHPYYDNFLTEWLEVSIDFSKQDILGFEFRNNLDVMAEPILSKRIDAHMKVHGLKSSFATHAISEMNSKKRNHLRQAKIGKEKLKMELQWELNSFQAEDNNSWRSALYRELIENYDEYYDWLLRLPSAEKNK